jgi:hypothetical protein
MPHPPLTPEPLCCGDPMIHNSGTGMWECAAAYFDLTDSGAIDPDWSDRLIIPPEWTTVEEVEQYHHWRDTMTPDGYDRH